jgi:DNA-3-methyladenine glycosylase II
MTSAAPFPKLTMDLLRHGLAEVAAADADVAAALAEVGPPGELRIIEPGFAGLLRIIVGQQVSAAAAHAIWARITDAVVPLDPPTLLAALEAPPARLGLSRPKRDYARGLAEAVMTGALDPGGLAALPDDGVVAAITALRGFGRWSAGIYLLFALGRPDAWPPDDLALHVGVQRLKGLAARPGRLEVDRIAGSWQPWRGAMATFLWHYYHRTGGQQQFADARRESDGSSERT